MNDVSNRAVREFSEFLDRIEINFFFFKQKTAYEICACLVGSEMCIRDSRNTASRTFLPRFLDRAFYDAF